MKSLAIIIPAYKVNYLDTALQSLANQTRRDFNVYIGDDCSPEDIASVVLSYQDRLSIIYKRFSNNLGKENLISQWNRCLNLAKDESWIWFFSDDDVLSSNCVERFYQELELHPRQKLFHINTTVIDSEGNPTSDKRFLKSDFPEIISSRQFIVARLRYKINSFAVEYIFNREAFCKIGGFVSFDMAWGSDDATWARMAQMNNGIYTISGTRVYWRKSALNITPNNTSVQIAKRKLEATLEYLIYCRTLLGESHNMIMLNYYFHMLVNASPVLKYQEIVFYIREYKKNIVRIAIPSYILAIFVLLIQKVKRYIK